MPQRPIESQTDLALVRTDLANERTLLAYGRTALMVAATGATLLKFYPDSELVEIVSWPLIGIGALIALVGAVRFTRLQSRLHAKHRKGDS